GAADTRRSGRSASSAAEQHRAAAQSAAVTGQRNACRLYRRWLSSVSRSAAPGGHLVEHLRHQRRFALIDQPLALTNVLLVIEDCQQARAAFGKDEILAIAALLLRSRNYEATFEQQALVIGRLGAQAVQVRHRLAVAFHLRGMFLGIAARLEAV